MALSCLTYSSNIAVSLLNLWPFKQYLVIFLCLNIDIFGVGCAVMLANLGNFTLLLFDICQLKQLLLLSDHFSQLESSLRHCLQKQICNGNWFWVALLPNYWK